jgi:hypothetical protein
MTVRGKTLTLKSTVRRQLIDITAEAIKFVSDNDVTEGILTVSVPHATAAVIVNENEQGLLSDIQAKIEELFPQTSTDHIQATDAHILCGGSFGQLGQCRFLQILKDQSNSMVSSFIVGQLIRYVFCVGQSISVVLVLPKMNL